MQLILMVGEAVGLIVGSLLAAGLLCGGLWYGFRLVLHPGWAAVVVLILVVLALGGRLPKTEFLDMTLTFAAIAAAPLWIAGRAWCRQLREEADNQSQLEERRSDEPAPAQAPRERRIYPAITGCIGEERLPTRDELHFVASRLWREGFALRFGPQSTSASFAARRAILRAAAAALCGTDGALSRRQAER